MEKESEENKNPGSEGPTGGATSTDRKSENKQEKSKDHVILEEKHADLVRKNEETEENFKNAVDRLNELEEKLKDTEKAEKVPEESELFKQVKELEGRNESLGTTLDGKNKEIKSLQAQLRKARKFVPSPIQRH